jgi:hypothetical protein
MDGRRQGAFFMFYVASWQVAEKLFSEGVIPSAAGAPGNGRFCRCWGGGARDLLLRELEAKQIPRSRKSGATSG